MPSFNGAPIPSFCLFISANFCEQEAEVIHGCCVASIGGPLIPAFSLVSFILTLRQQA